MAARNKGFSEAPSEYGAKTPARADVLKVRPIGNSLGVVLSKELLGKLRVAKGDALYVVETPDGIELRAYDPEFKRHLEAGRSIAKRYRNALRELAK